MFRSTMFHLRFEIGGLQVSMESPEGNCDIEVGICSNCSRLRVVSLGSARVTSTRFCKPASKSVVWAALSGRWKAFGKLWRFVVSLTWGLFDYRIHGTIDSGAALTSRSG